VSRNTALVYLDAIGNNFSKSEQARIQETLPSCKMLFQNKKRQYDKRIYCTTRTAYYKRKRRASNPASQIDKH